MSSSHSHRRTSHENNYDQQLASGVIPQQNSDDDDIQQDDLVAIAMEAADLDYRESLINERHEGIKDIQQDIHQIQTLYQDLSTQVHTQGEELDNIEARMLNAVDNTEQANVQLEEGAALQRNRTSWYCAVVLIVLVVLMLSLIAAVWHPGRGVLLKMNNGRMGNFFYNDIGGDSSVVEKETIYFRKEFFENFDGNDGQGSEFVRESVRVIVE